jgi:hypothetical protein
MFQNLFDYENINFTSNEYSFNSSHLNLLDENSYFDNLSSEKKPNHESEFSNDLFIDEESKLKADEIKIKDDDFTNINKTNPIFKINKMPFYEKDINNLINKMNINEEMKNLLTLNAELDNEEIKKLRILLFMKDKKRMKKECIKKNLFISSKKGRKLKDDKSYSPHNKYTPDNIVNFIKTRLNDSLLLFLNKLICSIYSIDRINQMLSELHLKKDRKSIDKTKVLIKNIRVNKKNKLYNLKLLNLTIKDYISQDISPKNKKPHSDYNKRIIQKLLDDEQNRHIFDFIFKDLKIEDWLDIFIYKKEIDNYINKNKLNICEINVIKENLIRIDNSFLEKPINDELYIKCFILMIYNYKRYLLMKEGRVLKFSKND